MEHAVAKSYRTNGLQYMGKYVRISSYTRKLFLIYDLATAPIQFDFLFYQCIKEFTCAHIYTGSEIIKNFLSFIIINNLKIIISSHSSAPLSAAPLRLVRRALLRHGSTAGQPAAAEAGGAGVAGAAPPRPFLVSRRGKLTGDIPA
jgi:hypothetical protein